MVPIIIAAIGTAVTVGTIVYLAGRMQGQVGARLHEIERRLSDIEHALARMGFTFRVNPRNHES